MQERVKEWQHRQKTTNKTEPVNTVPNNIYCKCKKNKLSDQKMSGG